MPKVLFITPKDLKRFTMLNGNLDDDKFIQYIEIAQEIHIQTYLGTKLYNRLRNDIEAGTLNADYQLLLDDYIKPMVIHWAMVEYLPYAAYQVANGGVFKHSSETSETVSKTEVDYLVNKQMGTAQHYTRRFIDFMCYNQTTYPEYNRNVNSDVYPLKESHNGGWVL